MNVIELLADLQIRQDAAATRAGELREQIKHLNAALAEAEAGLSELVTTPRPLRNSPRPGPNPNRLS